MVTIILHQARSLSFLLPLYLCLFICPSIPPLSLSISFSIFSLANTPFTFSLSPSFFSLPFILRFGSLYFQYFSPYLSFSPSVSFLLFFHSPFFSLLLVLSFYHSLYISLPLSFFLSLSLSIFFLSRFLLFPLLFFLYRSRFSFFFLFHSLPFSPSHLYLSFYISLLSFSFHSLSIFRCFSLLFCFRPLSYFLWLIFNIRYIYWGFFSFYWCSISLIYLLHFFNSTFSCQAIILFLIKKCYKWGYAREITLLSLIKIQYEL